MMYEYWKASWDFINWNLRKWNIGIIGLKFENTFTGLTALKKIKLMELKLMNVKNWLGVHILLWRYFIAIGYTQMSTKDPLVNQFIYLFIEYNKWKAKTISKTGS